MRETNIEVGFATDCSVHLKFRGTFQIAISRQFYRALHASENSQLISRISCLAFRKRRVIYCFEFKVL